MLASANHFKVSPTIWRCLAKKRRADKHLRRIARFSLYLAIASLSASPPLIRTKHSHCDQKGSTARSILTSVHNTALLEPPFSGFANVHTS